MIVNLLVWAVFGLVAGVAAKFIDRQPERFDMMGTMLTSVLGIAGALIGGLIASQLFNWDINTFSIAGFAVAIAGAPVLLFLFLYHMVIVARRAV